MAQDIKGRSVELLVVGGSAGSLEMILKAFSHFRTPWPFAIVIVLHRKPNSDSTLVDLLSSKSYVPVSEANEKEAILPGRIYIAPADYHLLIESDRTFSLDFSEKVNYSRPCIDVTFELAAEVYGPSVACLLLSGASADGVEGLVAVREAGGIVAVQDPETAEVPYMPQKAIERLEPDYIVGSDEMFEFIGKLAEFRR